MYGSVFLVPFVLLIVSASMFFPYITGKNFAFRILVEIGFAAWALLALIDRDFRPHFSWITASIASLVVVMLLTAILGEYPAKSIWSNFERMEGWVTLVHFFMYFLVLSTIMKSEVLWNRFLNTALIAASIMSLYALSQIAGVSDVSQGTAWRVDGRLGNSSYLGVYMLFHMFIAAWLFVKTKSANLRYLYGALFFIFGFVLLRTGTRGSTLGLLGGSVLAFSYVAVLAPKRAPIKKWALGGLLAVVLMAAGLWLLRDAAFVKESAMLNRVANITLAEGNIRFMIWNMALEGVKERPILGWGQENFSYVFNKYYDPALYGAEPWYDRTHNIFLDWLITGGVLGLIAYLFILATALWYAVIAPAWARLRRGVLDESKFTVNEQALLLGLLAAYMFHNLFVFDNLASWIFYAAVLALIHSRVSKSWPAITKWSLSEESWSKIFVPAGAVATLAAVYFINVPGILAAKDIIASYRETTPDASLARFESALGRDSFATQEIVEQMAQAGAQRMLTSKASEADKEKYAAAVETALDDLIESKGGDARVHVVAGGFYRMAGDFDRALSELKKAEELSPRKQDILEEQALIMMAKGDKDNAVELYRRSYELAPDNQEAKVRLAAAMLYADDTEGFEEIIDLETLDENPSFWYVVVTDELLFRWAYEKERFDVVEYMLRAQITLRPENSEVRTNLAALLLEEGDKEGALAVLRQAITDIPSFKTEGERLINSVEKGNN